MDILDRIVAHKKIEVGSRKQIVSTKRLERSRHFGRTVYSLKEALLRPDTSGIIAEFKRYSPSKKEINTHSQVQEVTTGYAAARVAGISVLTDHKFFKGSSKDLLIARKHNTIPILRKEFIIDEYQLLEAKALGADVILLIAECLEKEQLARLAKFAKSLGLEVITEIHSSDQLRKLTDDIDIVGVNNRNLKTFKIDLKHSKELFHKIPNSFIRISESGISDPDTIVDLSRYGFQGFLIGENFMKTADPSATCKAFIQEVNSQLIA